MVLRRDRRHRRLDAKKLHNTFALDGRQHVPRSSLFLWLSTPKHVRLNFSCSLFIHCYCRLFYSPGRATENILARPNCQQNFKMRFYRTNAVGDQDFRRVLDTYHNFRKKKIVFLHVIPITVLDDFISSTRLNVKIISQRRELVASSWLRPWM